MLDNYWPVSTNWWRIFRKCYDAEADIVVRAPAHVRVETRKHRGRDGVRRARGVVEGDCYAHQQLPLPVERQFQLVLLFEAASGIAIGSKQADLQIVVAVGGEEVARAKPDPEMIHIILDRLGVDRSQAVMVGDALNDVQMGANAGLKASIGVLTGFATAEQMRALTSFVAQDVSEIAVLR